MFLRLLPFHSPSLWHRGRLRVSCVAMAEEGESRQHVAVCGAGVIGACTAFFLAQKGVRVTIVEKTGVACAASGKAGGFLALDWCDGGPLGKLARASFKLHETLAEELGGSDYGYRRLHALSVSIVEDSKIRGKPSLKDSTPPQWLDGPAMTVTTMGSTETTAQVHPKLFTQTVLSAAVEKYGATLLIGDVTELKIEQTEGRSSKVTGIVVDGEFLRADAVVVAMGPWSASNKLVSDLANISPLKSHSIVLRPKMADAFTPHAVFLSYKTREGRSTEPEIYPRASGEVYICGASEKTALPDDAEQVEANDESIALLKRVAATVSSHLSDAELTTQQACLLPCSEDGIPLIGKIPSVQGAYVATGHGCWGILNAPATGASLAELVVHGTSKTVDLKPFDPVRFVQSPSSKR